MSNAGTTTVEGHVVDLACLRRYPENEYGQRARMHTTSCALMGHCVESGYGVIDDGGTLHVLDTHATPLIVAALHDSSHERGVYLVVDRSIEGGEMVTQAITEKGQQNHVSDTRTDEYGNIVNPPGPSAGDPGRGAIKHPTPAEECEPQTAVEEDETGEQRPAS